MSQKRYRPEEIIAKLGEAEVLIETRLEECPYAELRRA